MRAANALRWGGAIALAALALMRCVVLFAPRVVFDIDPILDPLPLAGLGPAGSMAIDVLVLVAAACVLAGEVLADRFVKQRDVFRSNVVREGHRDSFLRHSEIG